MTDLGLNLPADARIPAQAAWFLGARWTRVVAKPDVDLRPWMRDAKARGLKILLVIARESFSQPFEQEERWTMDEWLASLQGEWSIPVGVSALPYLATCQHYAGLYGGLVDAVQGGNEADHESPSSWTMSPSDLNGLLLAINTAFGAEMYVVGPGLVSGNPEYMNGVDLDLLDAIAVHPYGQRPDALQDWSETPGNFGTVAGLLDSYRRFQKPIWVTEVGVSTTQVSEDFQARYCEAMMRSLKLRADVPVAMWFCHDDLMVPEFGLMRESEFPKPAATAFARVAGPVMKPEEFVPVTDPNVHAIDVASYQPKDLTALIQAYQVKHVVVHLYMPNEGPGPQWSRDQINSARQNGCTVGGYVFPYRPSDDIAYYLHNTLELCASVGLQLPVCWVDCEPSPFGPGPDEAWMDQWFAACDSVNMPSGLYLNQDWLNTHSTWKKYGLQGRPLWLAHWDHVADTTAGPVPAGWAQLAGKQWEVSSGHLGDIDRDVFREEYTVYAGSQQQPQQLDPCRHLHEQIEAWINAKHRPTLKQMKALLA